MLRIKLILRIKFPRRKSNNGFRSNITRKSIEKKESKEHSFKQTTTTTTTTTNNDRLITHKQILTYTIYSAVVKEIMTMMLFSVDKCNDTCGFLAAFIGALCYGSYGVPIKAIHHEHHNHDHHATSTTTDPSSSSSSAADESPHPLILQTYKTTVVFITSWIIVLLHEEPHLSHYGLISGLLWVCGGTCGIIAIQKAGIATAVGTWASTMILVNFVWGIMIFHEPVQSIFGTCCAFFFLGLGLIGMTKATSPEVPTSLIDTNESSIENDEEINLLSNDNYGSSKEIEITNQKLKHQRKQSNSSVDDDNETTGNTAAINNKIGSSSKQRRLVSRKQSTRKLRIKKCHQSLFIFLTLLMMTTTTTTLSQQMMIYQRNETTIIFVTFIMVCFVNYHHH